jgi:hypothetical protein
MHQVSIKYTNVFHCKTLQNLPKFGFLVRKQIWQPWSQTKNNISEKKIRWRKIFSDHLRLNVPIIRFEKIRFQDLKLKSDKSTNF